MAVPRIDVGGTGDAYTPSDNYILGFWWSDTDWEWWPVTLGEIRAETGNTSMTPQDASLYMAEQGMTLRRSKPADGGPPTGTITYEDGTTFTDGRAPSGATFRYNVSGRDPGGGGGRGGGGAAASYIAPNKRTVEENVKAYVVATTGMYNKALVAKGVQAFMSEDKKAFDQRDKVQVDPWAAVQSTVRGSQEYKSIHQLRPEAVDEMEWVTSRQSKLMQLGISAQRAAEMGVQQAKVGGTDEDLMMASDIASASYKEIGQSQRNALTNAATNVARMIR